MSDKGNKRNAEEVRPRNVGPAGIPRLEYRGQGSDHTNAFLKFRTQWRSFVSKTFDSELECIELKGVIPTAAPIDINSLIVLRPKDNDPIAAMIFEQTVKTRASEREKKVERLQEQCNSDYVTLWNQLDLTMQSQLKLLKDFEASNDNKNVVWLWKAIQSICLAIVTVAQEDPSISALLYLTG